MSVTEHCKIHPDEVYTFYCRTHDMVYCPVCTVSSHGECIDVYFITEAPPIDEKAEEQLCDQFAEIIVSVDKRKQPIELDLAAFIQEKMKYLNELKILRDDIISKLDVIIDKARDEIQSEYQSGEDQFNEDLEKLSIVLTAVDCAKSRSNLGATKTKEQAFVDIKLGYQRLAAVQDMANSIKLTRNNKVAPNLFLEKDAVTFVEESIVKKNKDTDIPKEAKDIVSSNVEVAVGLPDCPMSSDITGMCVLQDKTFLLCDYNNKYIRWIKHDKLARSLPVAFSPFDACVVSDREIAVTAPKQQQIVLLFTFDFRKLRSFSTDKPCKGIASNKEHIFAVSSCWTEDSPGCILQFNKKGVLIREYALVLPSSSIPLSPVRLCLDHEGVPLFTDPRHGVFRLGLDGRLTHLLKDVGVSGVCITNHEHILVCRVQSDCISELSNSGTLVSTFNLPEVQWKVSMSFEKESSTLVIGSLNSRSVRLIYFERQ